MVEDADVVALGSDLRKFVSPADFTTLDFRDAAEQARFYVNCKQFFGSVKIKLEDGSQVDADLVAFSVWFMNHIIGAAHNEPDLVKSLKACYLSCALHESCRLQYGFRQSVVLFSAFCCGDNLDGQQGYVASLLLRIFGAWLLFNCFEIRSCCLDSCDCLMVYWAGLRAKLASLGAKLAGLGARTSTSCCQLGLF